MKNTIDWPIVILVSLAGLLALFVAAKSFDDYVRNTAVTTISQPAKEIAKLETKVISPKQVVVLEEKAKAKLNLPKPIQADTKQHVVAATKVDYSLIPKAVTTVLDEDTGQFTTYEQEQPRPWVSMRDSGSASLAYGFRGGTQVTRLSMRQDFLSVKAVSLGAVGHLDSDGQHFIGIAATYRW